MTETAPTAPTTDADLRNIDEFEADVVDAKGKSIESYNDGEWQDD